MSARDSSWMNLILLVAFLFANQPVFSALRLSHTHIMKFENDTAVVQCSHDPNVEVIWEGPKGILSAQTQPTVNRRSEASTLLKFQPVKHEHRGVYKCKDGKEEKQFMLQVERYRLTLEGNPEQFGDESTDVLIRCGAKEGKIIWLLGQDEIKDDKKYRIEPAGLLVKNANRNDSGVYICRARRERTGEVSEKNITLTIKHKPSPVYATSEQVYSYTGGTALLACEVEAEPPPTFIWTRKNRRSDKLAENAILEGTHKSVLKVAVDNSKSFGEYICKARNSVGEIDIYFSLEEGFQPEPVEKWQLLEADADSAKLEIHQPDSNDTLAKDMQPNGFHVEFRFNLTEEDWLAKEFDLNEDNIYTLTDLIPETEYHVRVATRNKAGISDFSNYTTFKTLKGAADSLRLSMYTQLVFGFLVILVSSSHPWW